MPTEQRSAVLTGGCQCGAVRYALYAKPDGVHLCHCRMCQKAVGNVFAGLAPVRLGDFAWTRGEPGLFRSSSVAERGFCEQCGTPLSVRDLDSEWIDLTIGSFDRPDLVRPEHNYGVESRVPWLRLTDGLPQETTEEHDTTGRLAAMVSHQHPDAETPE
jgi:hypothetical protein